MNCTGAHGKKKPRDMLDLKNIMKLLWPAGNRPIGPDSCWVQTPRWLSKDAEPKGRCTPGVSQGRLQKSNASCGVCDVSSGESMAPGVSASAPCRDAPRPGFPQLRGKTLPLCSQLCPSPA